MQDTINKYKIWNAEARRNPQAVYAKMRADDPIYAGIGPMTGRTFWFFTRYEDVVAALKDPRFGKDPRRLPDNLARMHMDPDMDPVFAAIDRHLLNLDVPDHTRLRRLVHKAFTPKAIDALRPRIQEIADSLLDAMQTSDHADLIESFAFPLPVTVIAELLGIPAQDQDMFRKWTKALLFEASEQDSRAAAMEFGMYMNEQIELRQTNPTADILSNLVHVEEQGDSLDRMELLAMIFLLLVAGHETTVNLIGNGILALLEHPDQLALLRANPQMIGTAVEEILRYNGPVETPTQRIAMEDVEWQGHHIKQGDLVVPALLAANHDPAVFENPEKFDITRTENPHIAFGFGVHFCLGAPLARMEGIIAINALLARLPNLRLNADPNTLEWSDQLLLRGVKALPVAW
jgi:cytochrome P450 PksS